MGVDFDGKEFDRTPFGRAFIDKTTHQIIPNSKIQLNINREKGFLRIAATKTKNSFDEWQQYRIEIDGTFTKLYNSRYTLKVDLMTVVSTVDEGYAFIFVDMINNNLTETKPFLPQIGLFVSFIRYNQLPVSPLLLYRTFFSRSDERRVGKARR